LDTASDDIALTLAKVYELTGRTAQARSEVDRVLRRSPGELRALYQLVELDPASRETYLGRIVERAPGNVAARLDLVEVLLARGGGGGGGGDAAAAQLEALERQLPELPREAHRFFEQALTLARAGRAGGRGRRARGGGRRGGGGGGGRGGRGGGPARGARAAAPRAAA